VFATGHSGDRLQLDRDHRDRAHAAIELAIRDLEHGAACSLLLGGFTANAARLVTSTVSHDLIRRIAPQLVGTPDSPQLTDVKTFRRRRLTIPRSGSARSSRGWTLYLPSRWPSQRALASEAALGRLRILPAHM
jgi:hypothetical protein